MPWRLVLQKKRTAVDNRIKTLLNAEYVEGESAVIEETKAQLIDYFEGKRENFTIPLELAGSEFQKQVWEALIQIPYGQTKSYLELSNDMENPKAIRAVASANGANAISILVPCHRIIGSNGDLTGYAGGINTKKKLLELEGALVSGQLQLF